MGGLRSRSPTRLWVGILAVMILLLEFPGALHKCIFDEVQAQSRVVQAAGSPPNEPRFRAQAGKRTHHPGWRSSPLRGLTLRQRRSLRNMTPTTPAATPQPIRIRSWIQRESSSLSKTERKRLEAAWGGWEDGVSTIPDDHLAGCDIYTNAESPRRTELRPKGAGVPDTDFLLYLHVRDTDKCRAEPNVLAYAVHCRTDVHGRPVAGVVVICRGRLTEAAYSHQAAVQTVIHELFHALGFSKHLFHTWRDCSSTSSGGSGCSPRGQVTHSDGAGQMRIYAPSVISALQKHLASSDPELGGPLENLDAPPGRVSSHWESRVLRGSIMAAVLEDSSTVRIDPVTLAALQDTGWYTVNRSQAQSLVWGDGEGAVFGSLSTCQDKSSYFFCTGSGFGCHYLHLHKGECQTDQYLEGCRMYKPLKNGSECWKEEYNRWTAEEDRSGEIFGFDSRCFFSSLTTQVKGYQGLVSCPDRRLCLYPDIAPPSDDVFPASITSDPGETQTWSLLCIPAAVCLLAAFMVSYRKCRSCRIRIQTAPE
ncbi:hypothetical protein D5F01_LYC22817 [Larimichthys crocea]|uniref:Leishmanolysin-like peptidase n=1 Tax=Larimichthys crocea TaxID=215358 RepID=A0A6G0HJM4_LARCR|nr:hypothetical protein D5F01_LYC22817 [Larimichthys crocea]